MFIIMIFKMIRMMTAMTKEMAMMAILMINKGKIEERSPMVLKNGTVVMIMVMVHCCLSFFSLD